MPRARLQLVHCLLCDRLHNTGYLMPHQQVKITIAQTNAADEPASIALADRKH